MQMGVGIRQSVVDVDTDSLLSQNWPLSLPVHWRSCSETDSATTEKHGRKKTEKNARNATEFLISVDLGKVWPPLLTSRIGRCYSVHVLQQGAFSMYHLFFIYRWESRGHRTTQASSMEPPSVLVTPLGITLAQ